jgi:3-oxoadipate enol-lactonase
LGHTWEAKGRTITAVDDAVAVRYTSAGVELSAWTRGSGQPVVLLHGSGLATHASLTELTRDLAAVCRVITCDTRGFGASVSRDPASHTWRQYALDVVALLDHLELGAAVVGGYSFGAAIALATALHHPDRVAGLILAQASFAGAERGLTPAQQRLWTRNRALLQEARTQGLKSALAATASSNEEAAHISSTVDDHDEPSLLAAHHGELQTAQPIPSLEVLQRVSVPTLLLPGDDDAHPPEISSWYAQLLPDATLGPSATAPLTSQTEAIREFLEHVGR